MSVVSALFCEPLRRALQRMGLHVGLSMRRSVSPSPEMEQRESYGLAAHVS